MHSRNSQVISRVLHVFLMNALVFLSVASNAQDNPHQTIDMNAYSRHDALFEIRRFNHRTLLEAYNKHGVKDPAWDEDARELLELFSWLFAYNTEMPDEYIKKPYEMVEAKYRDKREISKALEAANCQDPMIQYLIGVTKAAQGNDKEMVDYYTKSYEGFKKTEYPANRKFHSLNRLINATLRHKNTPEMAKKREQWFKDFKLYTLQALEQATQEQSFTIRDFVIISTYQSIDKLNDHRSRDFRISFLKTFLDLIEPLREDNEWAYNVMRGMLMIDYAWAHRGRGSGGTVKQDGWANFAKYLAEARESLDKAWRIEPSAMIAREMISIAMAGHAALGRDERYWFDRAKDVMFDDDDSWSRMSYSLMPRWGGSYTQMLDLAVEAVNTGRFDTAIPYRGALILKNIENDRGDATFWSHPKAIDAMDRLARGMDASPLRDHQDDRWFVLMRAAYMWKGLAFDRALDALNEAGELDDEGTRLALQAFGDVEGDYYEALGEIHAQTSPAGEQIIGGVKLSRRGQFDQAKEIFTAVLKKDTQLHPKAREYVQIQLQSILFQEAYETHKPVRLDGKDGLLNWQVVHGQWEQDEQGALIASGDTSGLAAVVRHPLPGFWEMNVDFEIIGNQAEQWANAGITMDSSQLTDLPGFYIFTNLRQNARFWVDWRMNNKKRDFIKPGKNTLKLRFDNPKTTQFFVNGRRIFAYPQHAHSSPRTIGLKTMYRVIGLSQAVPDGMEDTKVRFSNITVQQLPAK